MRSMSPKQVKITPGSCGDRDAVVDAPHRDHAHGAARPVDELDVRRQQVVDPVLVDRVRVAAADLHELVVAARLDGREDLPRERAAEAGVAELVDEPHAAAPRGDGRARVDEQHVADRHRARRARSRRSTRAPASSSQSARPRSASIRRTRIGSASSPQVMQCSGPGGLAHSITLALSSSSSCSYSAPISTSSWWVAIASASSIRDMREADVDQHPVARPRRRREPDVDAPPDARDLDQGEVVLGVVCTSMI